MSWNFYCESVKVKRGYYTCQFFVLSEDPTTEEYGAIIKRAHERLEKQIEPAPEFWLWTHNRWKHKRPIGNL